MDRVKKGEDPKYDRRNIERRKIKNKKKKEIYDRRSISVGREKFLTHTPRLRRCCPNSRGRVPSGGTLFLSGE